MPMITDNPKTPAFIADRRILESDLKALREIADRASCKLLYSPKACALTDVLGTISRQVDGFACSSLFELKLIDRLCGDGTSLHLVSPLLKPETIIEIGGRLDYLTLNSLTQWDALRDHISGSTRVGIRINPQISFIRDQRYDPCKPNSKLGVPIDKLAVVAANEPGRLDGIGGLHFHSNCDETDFSSLLATVRHIRDVIPEVLRSVDWINMGGGYLF
ncbi:MAG: 2Fe-2S ferredoxin, partial [Proteobacteria bacterium]|nr:2Fe-2S ferredoxin [Pseudomonadota bacterium]